jgi:ADP-heptose:LPS heptosyltransferase
MKILIIQTASIGDVILATALTESLHRQFPGAAIDILIKKGNEGLFSGHPYLNGVLVWNKGSEKYAGFLKLLLQVRKSRYDLVVNVQRFFLTGLLTVLSKAQETRGFSKNPLSFFFTRATGHSIGTGTHEVMRNHALISDLAPRDQVHPALYPSESDKAVVHPFAQGVFYTISPASLWFTKQYPVGKWVELVREIPGDKTVYLLGGPADRPLCDEIIEKSGHPGIKSLAGKLSLLQSAALMKEARMNFTNDSSPMHLASAVDAPVTAIFCSTVPGFGFGPLSSDAAIAETGETLSCRPCGLHGLRQCPEKHFHCALTIDTAKLKNRL